MTISSDRQSADARRAASLVAFASVLSLVSAAADAAASRWMPERPIELSVGAGPGTPTDITIRTMGRILQDMRLVPVPVTTINRAGAGGELGLHALSQRPGDAHYVFIEPINILTNEITGKSKFAFRDFTPLSILFSQYVIFVVKPDSPIRNGSDLLAALRKDPTSLSVAIGTTLGNSNHIALGLAMRAVHADVKRAKTVVFSGAAAAMTALLGGHVDLLVSPDSNAIPQLEGGTVRAIAIAAPRRLGGALAAVPTWKEQGVDVVFSTWRSLLAPKGLTAAQIEYWDEALGKLVKTDEWSRYLASIPAENEYMNSRQATKFISQQHEQLQLILRELGLAKK